MSAKRFLIPAVAVLAPAALFALPTSAGAVDVNVYSYGPRPVVVAPPPRVYVAPARTVVVAPRCVTRSARVWVAGRYVYRSARVCT